MENQDSLEVGEENQIQIKGEEIYRVSVSKSAEEALSGIVERVNHGFEGGRVNRTQMINWILIRYAESLSESEVKEVRAEHFDDVAFLEIVLRKAKKTGKVPLEIKALLQKQLGLDDSTRPRPKRDLKKNVINDDINKEGDR